MTIKEKKRAVIKRTGLLENDFYFNENEFMVFTASYHLKRGYCCKNNCLHCPYKVKKKVELENI